MSDYRELLRDPRWQKLRLQVFERDAWMCLRCRDTETELHAHHTYYEYGRAPWEYHTDSLVTLCKVCHGRISDGSGYPVDPVRTADELARLIAASKAHTLALDAGDVNEARRAIEAIRAVRAATWNRVRAWTPEENP